MPFGIGPLELVIVLVLILVIFGPKRLPQAGRSLGQGFREFKESVTGKDKDSGDDEAVELPPAPAPEAAAPPAEPAAPPAEQPAATTDASRAFGRDD
jgi:sec-independent protein translocase protein TatA